MPLCLVALFVFSVMSLWSAKYRPLAKQAFKCFTKTLTLSPCDMAFEQRVKAKVTAKLLNVWPALARYYDRYNRFPRRLLRRIGQSPRWSRGYWDTGG